MVSPDPHVRIASPVTTEVGGEVPAGRIVGALAAHEDRAALERTLVLAPFMALGDEATVLCHADLDRDATGDELERARESKVDAIRCGRAKRYVLKVQTDQGPRVVKIAEVGSIGNAMLGWLRSSVSRREHAFHLRAQGLGLAATRTLGFLEWRRGFRLVRACQIQTVVSDELESLDSFLRRELDEHGDAALDSFAAALWNTHRVPFFHADLKGFHAFAEPSTGSESTPATYDLRWIDLARVSFHMTPRKRIINLYQALRFIVPKRPEAQERFITAYCRASGWCADKPARALAKVRKFLDYKYRTHPNA